jgi:hypothetical protein
MFRRPFRLVPNTVVFPLARVLGVERVNRWLPDRRVKRRGYRQELVIHGDHRGLPLLVWALLLGVGVSITGLAAAVGGGAVTMAQIGAFGAVATLWMTIGFALGLLTSAAPGRPPDGATHE